MVGLCMLPFYSLHLNINNYTSEHYFNNFENILTVYILTVSSHTVSS